MRAKTFDIANKHRSFHFTIQSVYVLEYKSVYILGNSCTHKMSTHPQVKMLFDLVLFILCYFNFFCPVEWSGITWKSLCLSLFFALSIVNVNKFVLSTFRRYLFDGILCFSKIKNENKRINKQTINAHKHAIDANAWLNCFHLKIAIKRKFSNQFNMSLLCLSIKQTIFHAELFVPYLSIVSRELFERVDMNINDIYITLVTANSKIERHSFLITLLSLSCLNAYSRWWWRVSFDWVNLAQTYSQSHRSSNFSLEISNLFGSFLFLSNDEFLDALCETEQH